MNIKNKRYSEILLLLMILFSSCESLELSPYDKETDVEFWKKTESAEYMVNQCYLGMNNATEVLYSDAMSDNAYTKVQDYNQAIGNGTFTTADSYVQSVWSYRYSGIRNCNLLLANINSVPGLTNEQRNRMIGEATFIRAYHYYQLYTVFGDVPFFKNPISISESQNISRTSKQEIVSSLLSELSDIVAHDYLPASYADENKGRITKWAAMTLKARMLMFEGRYAEASAVTSEIINDSGLDLFPSYEDLFTVQNENNIEVILDVQYKAVDREYNTQYEFLPPSLGGYAQLSPLNELVLSYKTLDGYDVSNAPVTSYDPLKPFENRDPRLAATIIYTGNSYALSDGSVLEINCNKGSEPDGFEFSSDCSATGYYIKKYWDNQYRSTLHSGLNIILMRYADVLLMHAEAMAEEGKLDEIVWNQTIKRIRERAGFVDARALNFPQTGDLISIVRNERRCELALEGLRFKDVLRWKIGEEVLSGWCHGIYTGELINADNGYVRVEERKFDSAKHYLWPIPQKEKDLNDNLGQNTKW